MFGLDDVLLNAGNGFLFEHGGINERRQQSQPTLNIPRIGGPFFLASRWNFALELCLGTFGWNIC